MVWGSPPRRLKCWSRAADSSVVAQAFPMSVRKRRNETAVAAAIEATITNAAAMKRQPTGPLGRLAGPFVGSGRHGAGDGGLGSSVVTSRGGGLLRAGRRPACAASRCASMSARASVSASTVSPRAGSGRRTGSSCVGVIRLLASARPAPPASASSGFSASASLLFGLLVGRSSSCRVGSASAAVRGGGRDSASSARRPARASSAAVAVLGGAAASSGGCGSVGSSSVLVVVARLVVHPGPPSSRSRGSERRSRRSFGGSSPGTGSRPTRQDRDGRPRGAELDRRDPGAQERHRVGGAVAADRRDLFGVVRRRRVAERGARRRGRVDQRGRPMKGRDHLGAVERPTWSRISSGSCSGR